MTLDIGSTLVYIHGDSMCMETTNTIEEWARDKRVTLMSVSLANLDDFLTTVTNTIIQKNKISIYRKQLNFIVICERTSDCLSGITDMVSDKDRRYGKRALFRHFSKWLFVHPYQATSLPRAIDTEIDNVAFAIKLILSQVQNQNSSSFTCTHVMTLQWTSTGREWTRIGEPCSVTNTSTSYISIFPNARRGLNGRKLTIVVLEWVDYCKKVQSPKLHPVTYTHVCRDLFDSLAAFLNFSYVFIEPSVTSWGKRLPNASWSGLLGMIARNEADLSGVPFGITMERSTVVTYSYMIQFSAYRVLYKKPKDEETAWLSLLSCFSLEVYLYGICAILWCMGLFKVMEEIDVGPRDVGYRRKPPCSSTTMLSIIIAIQVPLRQGLSYLPRKLPSRVFYTFWWFFCIVITSVYMGNLISILAVVREKVPFKNLEELATNTEFSLSVPRGSYIEDAVKHSNDSIMKALWKKAVASRTTEIVSSLNEHQEFIKLLRSGNHALIEVETVIAAIEQEIKDLRVMKGIVINIGLSLPFPLNSPLADLFSEKLMLLYDNGMLDGWTKKWSTNKQEIHDTSTHVKQLTIAKLQSALVACAAGIILAACILGTELIIKRLRRT
ncbi:glutamate receptor ionotropic, kainate 3-like [Haliotis cracherodii]|uniref:glutamate receptor ionotropic, kainate 3-like n=1 Tax=Haliotis cracherodii TaxID=6455 RepID=UPI0039E9602B